MGAETKWVGLLQTMLYLGTQGVNVFSHDADKFHSLYVTGDGARQIGYLSPKKKRSIDSCTSSTYFIINNSV